MARCEAAAKAEIYLYPRAAGEVEEAPRFLDPFVEVLTGEVVGCLSEAGTGAPTLCPETCTRQAAQELLRCSCAKGVGGMLPCTGREQPTGTGAGRTSLLGAIPQVLGRENAQVFYSTRPVEASATARHRFRACKSLQQLYSRLPLLISSGRRVPLPARFEAERVPDRVYQHVMCSPPTTKPKFPSPLHLTLVFYGMVTQATAPGSFEQCSPWEAWSFFARARFYWIPSSPLACACGSHASRWNGRNVPGACSFSFLEGPVKSNSFVWEVTSKPQENRWAISSGGLSVAQGPTTQKASKLTSTLTHFLQNRRFTWDLSQKRSFSNHLATANPNGTARFNTSKTPLWNCKSQWNYDANVSPRQNPAPVQWNASRFFISHFDVLYNGIAAQSDTF